MESGSGAMRRRRAGAAGPGRKGERQTGGLPRGGSLSPGIIPVIDILRIHYS